MISDLELLDRFKAGDQHAFALLAGRHADWIYSMASRRLVAPHLAEDVTQAVFLILATKKPKIHRGSSLSAWLFTVTMFACKEANRRELTRHRHESEAAKMRPQTPAEPPSDMSADDWEQIAPQLDDAVAALNAADKKAILLRYYERMSLADVGRSLGVSEDAARKRVDRALEKLKATLARKGAIPNNAAAKSIAGLSAGLAAYLIAPIPPTLAASLTPTLSAATPASLALAKGTVTAMTLTKSFTVAISLLSLLLLALGSYVVYTSLADRHRGAETVTAKNASISEIAPPTSSPTILPAAAPAVTSGLKVGVVISLRTATEVGWLRNPYGFNVQTRIIADLKSKDFELHPVVEPGSENDPRLVPLYARYLQGRAPILASDAAGLRALNVIVANEVWEATPELLEGITSAVEKDGIPLLNSGGIGAVKPELGTPLYTPSILATRLAGLAEGQYAFNNQASECEIVNSHPILGSLADQRVPLMLECNGVYGILPPGATPLIKLTHAEDVRPVGQFSRQNPAYTFYPLYVSSLGKGTIVGYQIAPWKPVPQPLRSITPDGFHANAVRWLATQKPPAETPASSPPATTRAAAPKRGEILRIDGDRITAMPSTPPLETQKDGPITYVMDESTRIFVVGLIEQNTNADGSVVRRYDNKPGNREDLKVGLRARIDADGEKATSIRIWRDVSEE